MSISKMWNLMHLASQKNMQGDFVIKIKKINLFYFLIGRLLQSEGTCWGLSSREGKGVVTPIFPPSLTLSTFSVPKEKDSPLSWYRQVWHFLNGTSMGLCREQRKSPEPKHLVSTWKTDLVLLIYGSPPVSCSRKWAVVSVFTPPGMFSTRTQLQSKHHVARQNEKFWVLPADESCWKRQT